MSNLLTGTVPTELGRFSHLSCTHCAGFMMQEVADTLAPQAERTTVMPQASHPRYHQAAATATIVHSPTTHSPNVIE